MSACLSRFLSGVVGPLHDWGGGHCCATVGTFSSPTLCRKTLLDFGGIKSCIRWAEHVARIVEPHKIIGKLEGKGSLGINIHKWKDNIKMDLLKKRSSKMWAGLNCLVKSSNETMVINLLVSNKQVFFCGQ
jgi:hypothetical protein